MHAVIALGRGVYINAGMMPQAICPNRNASLVTVCIIA